jgi:hypothetical protein
MLILELGNKYMPFKKNASCGSNHIMVPSRSLLGNALGPHVRGEVTVLHLVARSSPLV